jgi:secondary thiamine-phosphate synthase enzyme
MFREIVQVRTQGRGTYDITTRISRAVEKSGVGVGLCHLFLRHTSASLIICENADPTVRADLERFMARIAPDGDPLFEHDAEGPDDMPAHVRTILTQVSLQIPVEDGRLLLGTWQGIYLWEHRRAGHNREVVVSLAGGNAV